MANMIQAVAKARMKKDDDLGSPRKDQSGSPVKTVLGALGMPGGPQGSDYTKRTHGAIVSSIVDITCPGRWYIATRLYSLIRRLKWAPC